MYNIKTDRWTEGPGMLTPRENHACVTLGSHLYVVGGYNLIERNIKVVERIHMTACIGRSDVPSHWSKVNVHGYLSRFRIARKLFHAVDGNNIVILGGKSGYHGYAARVGISCISLIMCLLEDFNPYNQI